MKASVMARMGLGALRNRAMGNRFPLNVMFSVTNRCNSRCAYCTIPLRQQEELDTREALALVDHLARRGTVRIGLWGGEPLVREDIVEIVDRCADHGIWTTLDTNGYLYPAMADRLARLSHLMVSLDGREAHHDRNREPGSWRKAMRAVEVARERKLDVWTITVLSRNNLDDVDYVLDLAERYGFVAAFQVLHHNRELARDQGDAMLPSNAAYRDALRRLLAAKDAGRPVGVSRRYLRYMMTWSDFGIPTSETPHEDLQCLAGQLFCNIDTDGTVYPCSLQVGQFPGLNLREVGFDAAFDALLPNSCRACTATAFTEYSFLYGLDTATVFEWVRAIGRLGPLGSGLRLPHRGTRP